MPSEPVAREVDEAEQIATRHPFTGASERLRVVLVKYDKQVERHNKKDIVVPFIGHKAWARWPLYLPDHEVYVQADGHYMAVGRGQRMSGATKQALKRLADKTKRNIKAGIPCVGVNSAFLLRMESSKEEVRKAAFVEFYRMVIAAKNEARANLAEITVAHKQRERQRAEKSADEDTVVVATATAIEGKPTQARGKRPPATRKRRPDHTRQGARRALIDHVPLGRATA